MKTRSRAERKYVNHSLLWLGWHWGLLVILTYTPFAYRIPVGSALISWDIVMGVHWVRLYRRWMKEKS